MFNIVLYQPEIPPNTGNIIRLCANTGATLHLVHPLGFVLSKKTLKRAALDYVDFATIKEHKNINECLRTIKKTRVFALSTKGTMPYTKVSFKPNDTLLFGSETSGLPAGVLHKNYCLEVLRVPMVEKSRSINLSNTVAIVLYEGIRQLNNTLV
ncbi:MAG: tRNA (cytidine(34)-2'-O)-methyltransferase [Bacteroidetes bacterium]|nr:tRNA (cytidine(34)-2'-O)-methyltransferase [Bacteroidota bacterium]